MTQEKQLFHCEQEPERKSDYEGVVSMFLRMIGLDKSCIIMVMDGSVESADTFVILNEARPNDADHAIKIMRACADTIESDLASREEDHRPVGRR